MTQVAASPDDQNDFTGVDPNAETIILRLQDTPYEPQFYHRVSPGVKLTRSDRRSRGKPQVRNWQDHSH